MVDSKTKSCQKHHRSFSFIYLLAPVLVLWPKISWFGLYLNLQPDFFVFNLLLLLLTNDLLFQYQCLLAFGVIDSVKRYNFSQDISGPRPGCFCNSQASNSFASNKADVILRVRLFLSQALYYVSKLLHEAK